MPKSSARPTPTPQLPYVVSIVSRRLGERPIRYAAFDSLNDATAYVAAYVPVGYGDPFTAWTVTYLKADGKIGVADRGDNQDLITQPNVAVASSSL